MAKKTKAPSGAGEVILALPPERTKRLESDDLLVLLDEFGNDDLDPIVRTLNEAKAILPGTRLKNTKAYKTHAPDHRRYRYEIAADLRQWGSHDLISAIRGRTASYRTIVHDLCKRAKVKTEREDTVFEMEMRLLKKIAQENWDRMSPEDKAKAAAKAAAAAGGAAMFGGGMMAAQFAGLRLVGMLGGPVIAAIAGAWTVWDLLGPAYRVTMPCVLTIAETRLRLWCAAVADSVEC
jgi:uncharacterized protein YaaW (UPF0174 family)